MRIDFVASTFLLFVSASIQEDAIHLPIHRRGGRFVSNTVANLTTLAKQLTKVESKYMHFSREIRSNRLHRTWTSPDHQDAYMYDQAGLDGHWYTTLHIGKPPQALDVDIDMLTPDFYHLMTTSGQGTKFDTFHSSSLIPSKHQVHLYCTDPTDIFHLHQNPPGIRLTIPICQPPKSSRHTLSSSGTILGLAPFTSLSQLAAPSLLTQLVSTNTITSKIWSLTLLDSTTGILSLGGTLARAVERIKTETEVQLSHLSDPNPDLDQQIQNKLAFSMPEHSTHENHFKWTHPLNNGAARGWWQTLMTGVWIDGVKVLKNQPVILDINCPVILAPPTAARQVYANIGAGLAVRDLPIAPSQAETEFDFYAYPCLNPPAVVFEIAGWPFPVMQGFGGTDDLLNGPVGGLFSLGRVGVNDSNVATGYCVGRIVGTGMGARRGWENVGLRHTWVLGEPFFRGLGVVGDLGENVRIGVRSF